MKLFCCSDIHGFYDELKSALDEAGFDENNEEHWLISCGDALDRGPKPQEVINYLMKLPRCILIKGNHDQLIMDCIDRKFPYYADYHNGTFYSIIDLAPNAKNFAEACDVAYVKVKPFVDKMVNYFETEHFVFCHSWVPVNCDDNLPHYYRKNRKFSKKEDWRISHQVEWDRAAWVNPLEMAMNGFCIEKTICSGHWNCSAGWSMQNGVSEFGHDAIFDPFYYQDKLIMIDATTALSCKINCLVLEDGFIDGKSA